MKIDRDDVRVGGDVIMRGGVARIRCSALESRGAIGVGFSENRKKKMNKEKEKENIKGSR